MLQIVYNSSAIAPFSELELTQLLRQARANNARLAVTGMLLHHGGSFLQVLEGEPTALDELYARIARDSRHGRVVTLLRREIEARHFGDWAMGFVSPKLLTDKLPGFSDYLRCRGEPDKSASAAEKLLAAFRDGRLRSHVSR